MLNQKQAKLKAKQKQLSWLKAKHRQQTTTLPAPAGSNDVTTDEDQAKQSKHSKQSMQSKKQSTASKACTSSKAIMSTAGKQQAPRSHDFTLQKLKTSTLYNTLCDKITDVLIATIGIMVQLHHSRTTQNKTPTIGVQGKYVCQKMASFTNRLPEHPHPQAQPLYSSVLPSDSRLEDLTPQRPNSSCRVREQKPHHFTGSTGLACSQARLLASVLPSGH